MTVSDLALEDAAAEIVALTDCVTSLEADVRMYRELAQQTLHALHDLTVTNARLRADHHRLLDEYRALRVQWLRTEAA